MQLTLEDATNEDAAAIAALRLATSRQLTLQYGKGTWSFAAESEQGVRADLASSRVFVARVAGVVAATLRLSPRSPYLTVMDFFTPTRRPIYLTSMSVSPKMQRRGIGRECLVQARKIATDWGADTIRLDAYDANAGAGDFYRKCGYREVKRTAYNGTPLIFFETFLGELERLNPASVSSAQPIGSQ